MRTSDDRDFSVRIDGETKRRLDALAKSMNRSRSFVAAEAITTYAAAEEWQLGEMEAGLGELDDEVGVSNEKVAKWLATWGMPGEKRAPR